MKSYGVYYREYTSGEVKVITIAARTAAEAYSRAIDQLNPYALYVHSYTTASGGYHEFIKNGWDKPY